jgi:predicted DNA repair protein MutK
MAERESAGSQAIGRFLLRAMPVVLTALSLIGTIAMLWVGGGIILHSLHELGIHGPSGWAHGIQHAVEGVTGGLSGIAGWLTYAGISALVGLVLGLVIVFVMHKVFRMGHGVGPNAEAH